ncbi:MarR family winged helix-turn-helix transcriptional regulator [Kribbella sp. NPDC003505]|uniref:MarR family winged helix-turn-helix transcriptional regulator n=1 Tax=Kribbella sp. NPDC003505 TaxID=3154448 RepID=UPI0033B718FD
MERKSRSSQDDLVGLVQMLVAEGQRIAHVFAQRHGVHGTDVEALVRILVAGERGRPLTAGQLAAELGLTTGSVTTLLDRLERAGHVQRERDPADRRRVILRYGEPGRELAGRFFGPLGAHHRAATGEFTPAELEVVKRYLTASIDAFRSYRSELSEQPKR